MGELSRGKLLRVERTNRNLTIVNIGQMFFSLLLIGLCFYLARPVIVDPLPDTNSVQQITSGQYQKHTVYGFASMVFQHVNYWPWDGEIDYKKKIYASKPLMTESFAEWLNKDYHRKQQGQNINELKDRTKLVQVADDEFYSPEKVTALGNGTWEVELILDVKEEISNFPVKHFKGRFLITVVKRNVSKRINPWRLAIHGEPIEIERIQDYLIGGKKG